MTTQLGSSDSFELISRPFVFGLTNSTLEFCDKRFGEDTSDKERGTYAVLAMLSMTASVFVAWTIFYNPKLRQHPSTLIGYMCICEALSSFNALVWAIHPIDFTCYFGLHYLYSYSTFNT